MTSTIETMRSSLVPIGLVFALASTPGCTGEIVNHNGDSRQTQAPRFPRLSHVQWENTIQDLFRLQQPLDLANGFDADPPLGRFDNNVNRLKVTSGLWQDYQRAAEVVAETVTQDADTLATIVPGTADGDERAFIESFGARALRRPLEQAEIDRYATLFAEGASHYQSGDAFVDGVRITLEAMLQSPHFVYRVESSANETGKGVKLSGYEMANRLSYTLWNTMPDDALMDAARAGELDTADGLRTHAQRMLDDPRSRATFAHFHDQLFEMQEYGDLDKDPVLFPQWHHELGEMMRVEAQLFLESVVFDKRGTVGDFMTATHAYVNDELAALYEVQGSFGDEYVEVQLDPTRRAGFLTRLGFLTRNATLSEPDPIHRGVFVNLQMICRPLAALPNLPDDLMPVGDTNRERINSITGPGTCGSGCHSTIINPIGFALENYDAIGRYRTEDSGFPVDAAALYVFPDGRELDFQNGIELSRMLAETPDLHECYVNHLLEYMYGRDLTGLDTARVGELTMSSLDNQMPIRDLILDILISDAFRYRAVD